MIMIWPSSLLVQWQPIARWMHAVSVLALLAIARPIMASPIVDYQFNGNFDDSAGGSSIIVHPTCQDDPPVDPCNSSSTFGTDSLGTFWQWASSNPRGGGFTLQTLEQLGGTYTLSMRISFNDVVSFNKILDFKNRTSDNGLYFFLNGIRFFPEPGTDETFMANEVVDLTIARDASSQRVVVLVDSTQTLFEFTDSNEWAVAELIGNGSVLGFFHDDTVTSSEGTSGGKVYFLQIFNEFLPPLFRDRFEQ